MNKLRNERSDFLNTFSHIVISGIVNRYIKRWYGTSINKYSFIYGNIIPDYKSDYTKIPHYKSSMPDFLHNEILSLSNIKQKNSAEFDKKISYRLGIICHYLADFFCYAHSPKFNGGFLAHIKYEFMLGKYNRKKKRILKKIDFLHPDDIITEPTKLIERLNDLLLEYEEGYNSFGTDIIYTVEACVQLVISMLSILREKNELYPFYKEKELEDTIIFDLSNKASQVRRLQP